MATKAQTKAAVPAVKEESTAAVLVQPNLPDYIRNDQPARGSENVTTDDLIIPRLELIQGLSPAVKRGDPGFIQGAMPGMYNNSVSRQLYGEDCTVIPVHFSVQHIVWRDRQLAKQLGISAEGGFFGAFNTPEEANARAEQEGGEEAAITVIDTPTHLCLILNPETGGWEEIMIPMPKTKAKVSRQWNSLVKLAGGDRFSRAYKLTSVLQKNARNEDFYNFAVELLGFPSKDAYQQAEALYEAVAGGKMRTMDFADVDEHGVVKDPEM